MAAPRNESKELKVYRAVIDEATFKEAKSFHAGGMVKSAGISAASAAANLAAFGLGTAGGALAGIKIGAVKYGKEAANSDGPPTLGLTTLGGAIGGAAFGALGGASLGGYEATKKVPTFGMGISQYGYTIKKDIPAESIMGEVFVTVILGKPIDGANLHLEIDKKTYLNLRDKNHVTRKIDEYDISDRGTRFVYIVEEDLMNGGVEHQKYGNSHSHTVFFENPFDALEFAKQRSNSPLYNKYLGHRRHHPWTIKDIDEVNKQVQGANLSSGEASQAAPSQNHRLLALVTALKYLSIHKNTQLNKSSLFSDRNEHLENLRLKIADQLINKLSTNLNEADEVIQKAVFESLLEYINVTISQAEFKAETTSDTKKISKAVDSLGLGKFFTVVSSLYPEVTVAVKEALVKDKPWKADLIKYPNENTIAKTSGSISRNLPVVRWEDIKAPQALLDLGFKRKGLTSN